MTSCPHPTGKSERGEHRAFPEAVWLKSSLVSADLQSEAISTTFVESASASCELRAPKMLGFLATNIFHSNPG